MRVHFPKSAYDPFFIDSDYKWCTLLNRNIFNKSVFRTFAWPHQTMISGGFHKTLQWVRLANIERLLLRTPGPVHLGLAFVLMLRPFFPELVMSTDLLSFEHPSVPLFCLIQSCIVTRVLIVDNRMRWYCKSFRLIETSQSA